MFGQKYKSLLYFIMKNKIKHFGIYNLLNNYVFLNFDFLSYIDNIKNYKIYFENKIDLFPQNIIDSNKFNALRDNKIIEGIVVVKSSEELTKKLIQKILICLIKQCLCYLRNEQWYKWSNIEDTNIQFRDIVEFNNVIMIIKKTNNFYHGNFKNNIFLDNDNILKLDFMDFSKKPFIFINNIFVVDNNNNNHNYKINVLSELPNVLLNEKLDDEINKLTKKRTMFFSNKYLIVDDNYNLKSNLESIKFFNISHHKNIYWIRHAESCSNLNVGYYQDKEPINYKNNIGYGLIKGGNNLFSKIKSLLFYEPSLSFIGMQQAILLGSKLNDFNDDFCFICSSMTRTIMTALFSLRNKTNVKIYVCPYINEIPSPISYFGVDYHNTAVPSHILKQRIDYVLSWIKKNWIDVFDDIMFFDELLEIKNKNDKLKNDKLKNEVDELINLKILNKKKEFIDKIKQTNSEISLLYRKYKNIEFPKIDFSILEYFEKIDDVRYPNSSKFYDQVLNLPQFINKKNFVVYSHGLFIKENIKIRNKNLKIKQIKNISNTQIVKETIDNMDSKFEFIESPTKIRSSYKNFEHLNNNICKPEDLNGEINIKFNALTKYKIKY